MHTNLFSTTKSIGLLTLLFVFFCLVTSSTCNGKKSEEPTCVTLTKAQIQKWVDAGYTTDTANPDYMTSVRIKTAYAFPGTTFQVYVIGVRKNGSVINESLTKLRPLDTCTKKHIKFSEYMFTGINPADLSYLKILNPKNGKVLDSLEYLRLEPYDYTDTASHFNLIAFNNYLVGKGGVILSASRAPDQVLPCPPCQNCKTTSCPAPPTCAICGPVTKDTTGNNP